LRSLEDELLVWTNVTGDFCDRHITDRNYKLPNAWINWSICSRLFV
jgi:hypothetical protein